MEEIQAPKKERKFLKAVVNIAKVLANELVMGIARKFIGKAIDKVGNKRQGLVIAFIILASTFAIAQYPSTSNKQRLGYQTTGDGLVYRGRAADTVGIKSSGLNNAYFILDTINNILYNYIKTKGGWKFSNGDTLIIYGAIMPFDSITFNTAKDGTVGVGEVEYNDTQGSLIQGLKGGNVTNVIGQQLHQRVNNRTGATLTKGMAVYLSGSQGNRITVAKALGVTDAFSANTFGIVAESIANNQSGFVITEGLITNINTSALTEDSAVYLSPTVAGGLTSTKPQAPQHTVYIGVCVKSNPGSGELFVKIRNGQELDELHDVRITLPVDKASLYYKSSEGLWRDTTATLLVSDTAAMLTPYFKKSDTTSLNLTSRFAAKLNVSDTAIMLTNYNSRINLKLNISDTLNMLSKYLRKADTSLLNLNTRFASKLNLLDTATMLSNYLRSGIAASTYQAKLNGIGLVYANGTNISYDNSTYLTTGTAASTYLPLAGGTISGTINRQEGANDGSANTFYYNILNYFARRDNVKGNATAQITFTDRPGTYNFPVNVRTSDIYLMTAKSFNGSQLGQYLDTTLSVVANQDGGRVGISKLNPAYKLDVNGTFNASGNSLIGGTLGVTGAINGTTGTFTGLNVNNTNVNGEGILTLKSYNFNFANRIQFGDGSVIRKEITQNAESNMLFRTFAVGGGEGGYSFYTRRNPNAEILSLNIDRDGNSNFYGTLGVTGATTLSAPLTVNSSAVFNEGSTDSDFRVESDGNVNMVFVDASTDRVGIGTNAPTKTLDVNGEVRIATVSTTPTALLGKDGSNVVGELGLGTGMSVASGILSVQAAGASATGLVTSFGSQTFGGNKTFNGNVNISTGTLDVGSSATFGGRVKTNWLERNYSYSTSSSFTVSVNTTWQDINTNVLTTLTLPNPATYPGKELHLRQTGTGNLQSDSSNIIPFNTPPTGSTSTGILTASLYEAVTLVSDGTNWIIMQRSEN